MQLFVLFWGHSHELADPIDINLLERLDLFAHLIYRVVVYDLNCCRCGSILP